MSTHNPTPAGSSDGYELRSTRIFLRPIANPFALGFTGLAVATLLVSGLELGWLAIGLSLLLARPSSHGHSHELALLLFVSGTVMLASAGNAAHTKLVPAFVVALTGLRFILTGVYKLGNGAAWVHAAAWTGVVLCGIALYAVVSLETEDIRHRTVLPTLRRGKGKTVLKPSLAEQVEEVAAEAGVRSQL